MGDLESQEYKILRKYPLAAKRLAQYLMMRRDYDSFAYIYNEYNLAISDFNFGLYYGRVNKATLEFFKRMFQDNIYIPGEQEVLQYFLNNQYDLFVSAIEAGTIRTVKKADLIAKMQAASDNAKAKNRRAYFYDRTIENLIDPVYMAKSIEAVQNTAMLQD